MDSWTIFRAIQYWEDLLAKAKSEPQLIVAGNGVSAVMISRQRYDEILKKHPELEDRLKVPATPDYVDKTQSADIMPMKPKK